jgi:hypothetical protein
MTKIALSLVLQQKAMAFAISCERTEYIHTSVKQIARIINYARLGQPAQLLVQLSNLEFKDGSGVEDLEKTVTALKEDLKTTLAAMSRLDEVFDVDVKHITRRSFVVTIICE